MIHPAIDGILAAAIGLDAASIGASAVERAAAERRRACGLSSDQAYIDRLESSTVERQALVEAIVVPETWFFRDRRAFDVLCDFVLTEWASATPSGVLRVLSLPCSSGEEPYSMAMALLDLGLPPARFQIDAIDVSEAALSRARAAVYGKNSFRGGNLVFRTRYFNKVESGYALDERVRRLVRFRQGSACDRNLLAGAPPYDVAFCRNLLIYLGPAARDATVELLRQAIAPNGLLCVAPSEASLILDRGFTWTGAASTFAFRKDGDKAVGTGQPASAPRARRLVRRTPSPRRPSPPPRAGQEPPRTARPVSAEAAAPPPLDDALTLADAGRFAEAAASCEAHIQHRGPSADAFHLLGLVREAQGARTEAAVCYRKALYLDPRHRDALQQLVLLMEGLSTPAEARVLRDRERRLALDRTAR